MSRDLPTIPVVLAKPITNIRSTVSLWICRKEPSPSILCLASTHRSQGEARGSRSWSGAGRGHTRLCWWEYHLFLTPRAGRKSLRGQRQGEVYVARPGTLEKKKLIPSIHFLSSVSRVTVQKLSPVTEESDRGVVPSLPWNWSLRSTNCSLKAGTFSCCPCPNPSFCSYPVSHLLFHFHANAPSPITSSPSSPKSLLTAQSLQRRGSSSHWDTLSCRLNYSCLSPLWPDQRPILLHPSF